MKMLTGFILALMILGSVAGCQQTPTEVTYKEVSIGSMRFSLPTDWQRPEAIEEIVEETISGMAPGMEQYVLVDAYEVPKSEDVAFLLMVMDMSKAYEAEGMVWEGWQSYLEGEGMTKEDMLPPFIAAMISEGAEEMTQQQILQHTIHGCEAVEGIVTFKLEGEPALVNLLLVFAENDLGVVVFMGEKSAWEEYEDAWHKIRDSVQFQTY